MVTAGFQRKCRVSRHLICAHETEMAPSQKAAYYWNDQLENSLDLCM